MKLSGVISSSALRATRSPVFARSASAEGSVCGAVPEHLHAVLDRAEEAIAPLERLLRFIAQEAVSMEALDRFERVPRADLGAAPPVEKRRPCEMNSMSRMPPDMSLMFPERSSSERYAIQRSRIVAISSRGSTLGAGVVTSPLRNYR